MSMMVSPSIFCLFRIELDNVVLEAVAAQQRQDATSGACRLSDNVVFAIHCDCRQLGMDATTTTVSDNVVFRDPLRLASLQVVNVPVFA